MFCKKCLKIDNKLSVIFTNKKWAVCFNFFIAQILVVNID